MNKVPDIKTWQFWIDRGGTFTDIVASRSDGYSVVKKILSENPEMYSDASVEGIRQILGIAAETPLPIDIIETVKMGTTIATNALLERKGEPTVLLITEGFRDVLKIGYQNRPELFALQIQLPQMIYSRVIEVCERYSAKGEKLLALDVENLAYQLKQAYSDGFRSCAIVFMHGYRFPENEINAAKVAKETGFTHISVSHVISPLIKIVSRGDTTLVDAYLSPVLDRYVKQVESRFGSSSKLMFMQSNGGLINCRKFRGKDSIFSGPAAGVVGAVRTSIMAGFEKVISFDMGGTSTDVAHFSGEYERTVESEVSGMRIRTPVMSIHTVAAGGGSMLSFDGSRLRVGPESAGANPGPACYRRSGPLTVTDANVMLGRIVPRYFPKVFGRKGDLSIDADIVRQKFDALALRIKNATGEATTPEATAEGFLRIAVEIMANAIKKISLQRGYDVSTYTLCSFGGAGGQHACDVAEALGIRKIFIHRYAGVLSAYGMGLADIRAVKQKSVELCLEESLNSYLENIFEELKKQAEQEVMEQNRTVIPRYVKNNITILYKLHLKYEGTESFLPVNYSKDMGLMRKAFEELHNQRYGFVQGEKTLVVDSALLEMIQSIEIPRDLFLASQTEVLPESAAMYMGGRWNKTPVFKREELKPGKMVEGPAIITEDAGTNVIPLGWRAKLNTSGHIIISRGSEYAKKKPVKRKNGSVLPNPSVPDPVMLEVFNNMFRAVAEQMGVILQNTSTSVNIKERLDFSCAVFDGHGSLVANAHHIPVHLGSMSQSVKSLIKEKADEIRQGDVYISNNPYNGGTHLPDITVITPVFTENAQKSQEPKPLFYVACRGHHADIGGLTPGSMPPHSRSLEEEGVLIDNMLLVRDGSFSEKKIMDRLINCKFPARNPKQNITDIKAQIAANTYGVLQLQSIVENYGLSTALSYMHYLQETADMSVRRAIDVLHDAEYSSEMDCGAVIKVKITIDRKEQTATIDFSGTSEQMENNFNAPPSIARAAVLFVFRCLVSDDIPLNEGCMTPLNIIIPQGCILNPLYPAAVSAGNVETSQVLVDVLFAALRVKAASQGTMNNFTFGNERYQYYETICGGSGAGNGFDGTDAVHANMTNTRITDPEVLEWRFPVRLKQFSIISDSGGEGMYRGGKGVKREIEFLESMTAAIVSERRSVKPFGLQGGGYGSVGKNFIIRRNGLKENLPSTAVTEVNRGDIFVIETPGGGAIGIKK